MARYIAEHDPAHADWTIYINRTGEALCDWEF